MASPFVVKTLEENAGTLREMATQVAGEGMPLTASVLRRIAGDLDQASTRLNPRLRMHGPIPKTVGRTT